MATMTMTVMMMMLLLLFCHTTSPRTQRRPITLTLGGQQIQRVTGNAAAATRIIAGSPVP